MTYVGHVAKVVGGAGVAALLWELLGDVTYLGDVVVVLPFFLLAVGTAVHGAFTGIEAAVAAGRRAGGDSEAVAEDGSATNDG